MAKKNILQAPPTREERQAAYLARQKKKKRQKIIAGVAVIVLPVVIWLGTRPVKGPAPMGVCRTFAELQMPYPETLRLTGVEQIDRITRMFYTYMGAYGEQHSNMIECKFYIDPASGHLALQSVEINRMPFDQDKVDQFSKTIGAVIAGKPSLSLPKTLSDDDLVDLRQD